MDITSTATQLRSSKVRDRNEGLEALESTLRRRAELPPKHLNLLVASIFDLISIELNLNESPSALQRLTRAADGIRALVELSVTARTPLGGFDDAKYRARTVVNMLSLLIKHQNDRTTAAFAPCVQVLLRQQFVRDHLTAETWSLCYDHAVKSVVSAPKHCKIFLDILVQLIAETAAEWVPVHDVDRDVLVDTLTSLVALNSNDPTVSVYLFKLLNKLIVVFSCQHFDTVRALVAMGFTLLRQCHYNFRSESPLNDQITVFLNLDPVYDPVLYSIDSPGTSSVATEIMEAAALEIDHCSENISGLSYTLNPSDVGHFVSPNIVRTWFKLRSVYLRSEAPTVWMLFCGLSKLIRFYYRLFHQDSLDTNQELVSSFSKKRRTANVNIADSMDCLSFYTKLLQSSSRQTKNYGLILATLHLELSSEDDLTLTSSSAFAQQSLLLHSSESLLDLIIGSISNVELQSWVLAALRSSILRLVLNKQYISPTVVNKIVLLLLQHLAHGYISDQVCLTFTSLVELLHSRDLHAASIFNETVVMQIENTVNLAEVSGPNLLSDSSFEFWFAIHKLWNSLSLRQDTLQEKCKEWFLAKWDSKLNPSALEFCTDLSLISKFINWLGARPLAQYSLSYDNFYNGRLVHVDNSLSTFKGFTAFTRTTEAQIHESTPGRFETLVDLDYILQKFLDIQDSTIKSGSSNIIRYCCVLQELISGTQDSFDFSKSAEYSIVSVIKESDYISLQDWSCFLERLSQSTKPLSDSLKEFIDDQFNSINERERSITPNGKDESFHQAPFDDFDAFEMVEDEFGGSRRVDQELLTVDEIFVSSNVNVSVVSSLVDFHKANGSSISSVVSQVLYYIRHLPGPEPDDSLICFYVLVHKLQHEDAKHLAANDITKLVRTIGEGPLRFNLLERSELIICTIARLLTLIIPRLDFIGDDSITNDCLDLAHYVVQLSDKGLLLTKQSQLGYLSLLLALMADKNSNDTLKLSDTIEDDFFSIFKRSNNSIRLELTPKINCHLSSLDSGKQMSFYSKLIVCFQFDQIVEVDGLVYCAFLGHLQVTNLQIKAAIIFNLLEFCSMDIGSKDMFKTLIAYTFGLVGESMNLQKSRQLFDLFKLEILRSWWIHHNEFANFPLYIFGFDSVETFYKDNQIYLAAIFFSFDLENKDPDFLKSLCLDSSTSEVILKSLPLAIPLAYVKGGYRNDIHPMLTKVFKDEYYHHLQDNLVLVVMKVLELTNFGDEKVVMSAFDPSKTQFIDSGSKVYESSSRVSVSFNSGFAIIKNLIKKFHGKDSFWSFSSLFFLTKYFINLAHNSLFDEACILNLRKIKLLLLMGFDDIFHYPLLKLIILKVVPFLSNSLLYGEVLSILRIIRVQVWVQKVPEFAKQLLVMLLFVLSKSSFQSLEILDSINEIISDTGIPTPLCSFLRLVVSALRLLSKPQNNSMEVDSLGYLEFLDHHESIVSAKIENSYEYLLQLLSFFFHSTKPTISPSNSTVISEILISNDISLMSPEFKMWAGETLANYYLKYGTNDVSHIVQVEEIPDVSKQGNFLEEIISVLVGFQTDSDIYISTIADITIGRMMHYDSEVVGDVSDVDYILPLSASAESMVFDRIASVADIESEDGFSEANSRCMSLIEDLTAKFPLLGPVSSFVSQVPESSYSLLPLLICLHISKFEDIQILTDAFKLFTSNKSLQTKKMCKMIVHMCLLVRYHATKNDGAFKAVYSSIDILEFINIASKYSFHDSALMILEEMVRSKGEDFKQHSLELDSVIDIFQSIDDEDIIHGLPEKTTLSYALQNLSSMGNTSDTIKYEFAKFDASILQSGSFQQSSLVNSMMHQGLIGTASVIANSNLGCNVSEVQKYDWSWRLNEWKLPTPRKPQSKPEFIYTGLKCFYDNRGKISASHDLLFLQALDFKDSDDSIDSSKFSSTKDMIQKTKLALEIIGTVFAMKDAMKTDSWKNINEFNSLTAWLDDGFTEHADELFLSRSAAFQILSQASSNRGHATNNWLYSLNELVRYNSLERLVGGEQKMVNATVLINEICQKRFNGTTNDAFKSDVLRLSKYQSSKTLWYQNHSSIAVSMMKDLQTDDISLPIEALNFPKPIFKATLVGWMADSRQALPSAIMQDYVLPTAEHCETQSSETKAKVFELLAKFCEKQSKSRNLNDQIDKLSRQVTVKKNEIDELKTHYSQVSVPATERKVVQKYYSKLKAQYSSELNDLEETKNTKLEFCNRAVEYYLTSIHSSDSSDESVDKFFSLWLEQSDSDDLNKTISELLKHIPTFRFVSWSSQLTSRLSKDTSVFQQLIKGLIKRFCIDHPYHSLYHLVSLRKQEQFGDSSNQLLLSKAAVATEIWEELKLEGDSFTQQFLVPVERFCDEAVRLSSYKVARGKTLNLNTSAIGTYWVSHLPSIPPPTLSLALDYSGNYDNVVTLKKISAQVAVASSGLSLPKIVKFTLSDGTEHTTIFKFGTDDLRQDAIMEQVFEKVNNIFQKDKETKKRKLRVRTYKIVPIGPKSGVIEFVPDSKALIDIIKPYHAKTDKMKLEKARELMKDCQTEDRHARVKVYQKIVSQVNPVFGHFFFDNFLTPKLWFQSKVNYNHGMATSSMVGHILGLGDRHCNNILLDKSSGEPIHIDLGVAFDQGKRLPIPETVPFRLTRDLVDGLGITGVEGIFKRCSEHTFRVLRENKDHIIAILDILRWDPLYSWNLSPLRKQKLQKEDAANVIEKNAQDDTSEAGRAIQMVMEKLNANGLSVEATVRELIQDATNADNLALIYCGWCPFY